MQARKVRTKDPFAEEINQILLLQCGRPGESDLDQIRRLITAEFPARLTLLLIMAVLFPQETTACLQDWNSRRNGAEKISTESMEGQTLHVTKRKKAPCCEHGAGQRHLLRKGNTKSNSKNSMTEGKKQGQRRNCRVLNSRRGAPSANEPEEARGAQEIRRLLRSGLPHGTVLALISAVVFPAEATRFIGERKASENNEKEISN